MNKPRFEMRYQAIMAARRLESWHEMQKEIATDRARSHQRPGLKALRGGSFFARLREPCGNCGCRRYNQCRCRNKSVGL